MPDAGTKQHWSLIIEPRHKILNFRFKELWEYRDLLLLLVKRDYIAFYKQTILGPFWFFIQPLLTMVMFVLIFNNIAGIKTDPVPAPLFYMVGIIAWNYFAECLNKTSTVFKDNATVFGKVYFPRLILPFSIVISSLVRFGVQLLLLILMLLFYIFFKGYNYQFNIYILLFPVFVLLMALFSLGTGMIISALTTKYRDLIFLISFGIQLFMYATPVIYSLNYPQNEMIRKLIGLNPLSPIFEGLRLGILGQGYFDWGHLGYSAAVIISLMTAGILIFNKTEKNFIDTV
ncbi:MAG TPA: ABC transporter permease [Chitinophagaceae bacterium]|nr:ABC transporter permease [Chitinophagaceae bacterium]